MPVFSFVAFLHPAVYVPQTAYVGLMPDCFSSDCSFPETWPFSFHLEGGRKACLGEWTRGEASEECNPSDTLISDSQPPKLGDSERLLVQTPQSAVLCGGQS